MKCQNSTQKNMDPILKQTLRLINSTDRRMPAHFTHDEARDRAQSFLIDFEPLGADDEYEMASEAWDCMGYFTTPANTPITKEQYPALVCFGEDVMVGAFIITKLGRKDLIPELQRISIADSIESFAQMDGLKELCQLPEINAFLDHCAEFGMQRAIDGNPMYAFQKFPDQD